MRVLVTGAGGFLGRYVVDQLLERGHSVRATIRPSAAAPAWPDAVETVRADLRNFQDFPALLRDIDVVVHLAAATAGSEDVQFASSVVATERLLPALAPAGIKRFVLISSLVVYDWASTRRVMDEGSPLVHEIYDMGAYTIAKVWQERVVTRAAKDQPWELVIARPGFIWGPGHAEIAGMGRRFGSLHLMFGPSSRLPLTHVVNCADVIVRLVDAPAASGEVFNIVDSDDITVRRYAKEHLRNIDQSAYLVPVPYSIGLGTARLAALTSRLLFGKGGKLPSLLSPRRFQWQFRPLRFSNAKLAGRIGWKPRLSFLDSLKQTYPPTNR